MYDACVPWPERPKGAKDKSRGPKGLKLEVGARRAPKLLVIHIIYKYFSNISLSVQDLASIVTNNVFLLWGWQSNQ